MRASDATGVPSFRPLRSILSFKAAIVILAMQAAAPQPAAASQGSILYYRDPTGAPYWSIAPRKDQSGRDYLPVYDHDEPGFEPQRSERRIIYYRNPMGLPDTSPVPKKDWMGMDYIAVYEDEAEEGSTIRISVDRLQRSGVRTEPAALRSLNRAVRTFAVVKADERRQAVVTMRAEGFVEELFSDSPGQLVDAGQPMFRIYSPQIQQAQTDLLIAARAGPGKSAASRAALEGPMQRLRNLGVPEEHIQAVLRADANLRTVEWPAPISGTVVQKNVVKGQMAEAGQELYRIVDLSRIWLIAEVPESEIGLVAPGMSATVTFRAWPTEAKSAVVTFVYPELNPRTRTGRIRIDMDNSSGLLKIDMFADVILRGSETDEKVIAVPEDAVIDSGTRQVVLVSKGSGRFEPREVQLGARADGYVEIRKGIGEGEAVVTAATFLIDAESNLKAALRAFSQPKPQE
jgi:membrane fusion protein, copper/silver efflux system